MNKKILFTTLPLLALSAMSCSSSGHNHHGEFTQIDENSTIYEVTYDDYDLDYLLKSGDGNAEWLNMAVSAGCSSCYSNGFYGRNFDFVYSKIATIVVRTPNHDGCYKTLGVTSGLVPYTMESLEQNNGISVDTEAFLPLMMLDGINEKGVVCSINCVNAADIGGLTSHTNEGAPKLNMECVVRYVIDHASTAKEGVDLIKARDIVFPRCLTGVTSKGYELHMMIADSQGNSYVVEFVEGGYKVTTGDNSKPETRALTNFYLYQHLAGSTATSEYYPANSLGVERYQAICEQLDNSEASDIDITDMQSIMESIKFTNSNKVAGATSPYPAYSDHPEQYGDTFINWKELSVEATTGPLHEKIKSTMMKDDIEMSAILNSDGEIPNLNNLWCTMHTSCYDIAKKELRVAEHENYGSSHANYQTFTLN